MAQRAALAEWSSADTVSLCNTPPTAVQASASFMPSPSFTASAASLA